MHAVSNLSDDPTVSGSLPYAIAAANSNPNPGTVSVIVFAIPQSLANTDGTFTIPLKSTDTPLTITAPVIIDATTQFNYAGIPLVEIDGENNGGNDPFAGLTLGPYAQGTNLGSTITGLAIVGFGKAGIDIESNKNVVTSDLIGVVPGLGSTGQLNVNPGNPIPNQIGILINGSSNTIGGTTAGAGNTIAFNTGDGIDVITGNGNAIRENSIYGKGEGIVLEDTVSDSQPGPRSMTSPRSRT